ncbi:hypothetical protein [Streptococcus sp. NLN64]|uniref:hypothetical protein n=1 Tax=Streptococcus sp. NLN64 TaxID=2822799 RepID=UPI0018CA679E|nr:hypothetical protein [Streptococcus sp. NLN64]MBG9366515.1 hypothetical protein [Streptococcus sp. NLN64]
MAKNGVSFNFKSKDFEKFLKKQTQSFIEEQSIEIACPNCDNKIAITSGKNPCPTCGQVIDFDTTLKF